MENSGDNWTICKHILIQLIQETREHMLMNRHYLIIILYDMQTCSVNDNSPSLFTLYNT